MERKYAANLEAMGWNVRTVNHAIKKLEQEGTIYRKEGSGRPDDATNAENTMIVEDLIQSQEDQPGTHFSQRQIATQVDVSENFFQPATRCPRGKNTTICKMVRLPILPTSHKST